MIPLYNKRDTVLRALNSVFSQKVQPEEIIIVNDGSTDGSEQVVAGLNHPLIKLIHQPNAGVSAARNRGIAGAKGDWIAFLDADDEWLPKFLETITILSEKYPQCSVLATSYFLQDYKGARKEIVLKKMPFKGEDGVLSNYFEVAVCSHPPIWTSSVTLKKSALEQIGGFPAGISSGEDLVTWAKLAITNDIGFSVNPLAVFIQDEAHTYNDKPTRIPQIPDIVGHELTMLSRQNKNIPGLRKYVALWFKMRASVYLRLEMKKQTFREGLKSLSFNPFSGRVFVYFILMLFPKSFVGYIFRKSGRA